MAVRTGPFWDAIEGRVSMPPAARTLGWTLRAVDADAGTIEVGFTARADFANPMGNVQGGFLSAMLDDTLGPALVATLGPHQFGVTLDLTVRFLRPAPPGRLVGHGRVVHRGGSIAFLDGHLVTEDGTVVATAAATARIIELPGSDAPSSGDPRS